MLNTRYTNHLLFGIKIAILSICLVTAYGGHYPPAHAQEHRSIQRVPVITTEDAMQDERIDQINKHLEATDARAEALRLSTDAVINTVSSIQGEERAIGVILSILSIVVIVLQVKNKQV